MTLGSALFPLLLLLQSGLRPSILFPSVWPLAISERLGPPKSDNKDFLLQHIDFAYYNRKLALEDNLKIEN